MNRKNKYTFQQNKKKSGKGLTIMLLISGVIMTGLVAWTGMNDWDIEKSFGKIGTQIGLIEPEENETPEARRRS